MIDIKFKVLGLSYKLRQKNNTVQLFSKKLFQSNIADFLEDI